MNLKEAVEFTFEYRDKWANGSASGTNRINCSHFLRILGPTMDVEEAARPLTFVKLTKALQEETLSDGSKRSNGGINRILAALSTVLNELYLHELVSRKPAYKRLPEKKAKAKFYSEEEMDKLFAAALEIGEDSQLLYESMLFAYLTGNRQGELLKLSWRGYDKDRIEHVCVDFDEQKILFLDTKNGLDHEIKMHERLEPILRQRFRNRLGDYDRVFGWTDKHHLYRKFVLAQKLAGLYEKNGRRWHSIRHTTGTHLISKGVQVRTVMGVLNHMNIETTLRYAKNTDETVANAIDVL